MIFWQSTMEFILARLKLLITVLLKELIVSGSCLMPTALASLSLILKEISFKNIIDLN